MVLYFIYGQELVISFCYWKSRGTRAHELTLGSDFYVACPDPGLCLLHPMGAQAM